MRRESYALEAFFESSAYLLPLKRQSCRVPYHIPRSKRVRGRKRGGGGLEKEEVREREEERDISYRNDEK